MQVHLTSPLTGEALRLETPEPRYTLKLVGFRPYGFVTLEEKAAARSEVEANICRTIPDLLPGREHHLVRSAHCETSRMREGEGWRYGDHAGACYWKATVRA